MSNFFNALGALIFENIINSNKDIFYYVFIFSIIIFFLLSINFSLKKFFTSINKIISFFKF